MNKWLRTLFIVLGYFLSVGVPAEELLMVRSPALFEESMSALQAAITAQGYTLSRVQRVDVGLSGSGFETDKYRTVFFARPDEIRALSASHPDLIPYMPLQIVIFAEGDETLLVAANPMHLAADHTDAELGVVFARWEKDVRAILERVRKME